MPAAVECADLRVEYGRAVVLDDVSFRLKAGVTCLIGRNGAGKTTLFRALAGIVRPTRGRVRVQGIDLLAQPAHKQAVGYLTHRPSLYGNLTVEQNLRFWARVVGLDWARNADHVEALLERFGVTDKRGVRAGTLSRGQQQRVAIARMLLARPAVVLMDEPATGLDALALRELHRLVGELARHGTSAIYATHSLEEAVRLGGQFLLLAGGRAACLDRRADLVDVGSEAVTLQVCGQPEPLLREAGLPFERAGDLYTVRAAGAATVQRLVARLVHAGCRIVEIRSIERLEDQLLRRLSQLG